ncbi:MAG: hypothetical protein JWR19_2623 [Pedosphaera sp.]|nr:hypothetical protein [Pedosphaera sp.]
MAHVNYKKVRSEGVHRGGAEARRVRKGDLAQGEEQWEQAENAEGDSVWGTIGKGIAEPSPHSLSRPTGEGEDCARVFLSCETVICAWSFTYSKSGGALPDGSPMLRRWAVLCRAYSAWGCGSFFLELHPRLSHGGLSALCSCLRIRRRQGFGGTSGALWALWAVKAGQGWALKLRRDLMGFKVI